RHAALILARRSVRAAVWLQGQEGNAGQLPQARLARAEVSAAESMQKPAGESSPAGLGAVAQSRQNCRRGVCLDKSKSYVSYGLGRKKRSAQLSILAALARRMSERRNEAVNSGPGAAVTQRSTAMRVMVMVKASKNSEAGLKMDDQMKQLLVDMGKFNEELTKAGVMLAGDGLKPSKYGKRVRMGTKDRPVVDGPFAETKELVAGYWIWQVK